MEAAEFMQFAGERNVELDFDLSNLECGLEALESLISDRCLDLLASRRGC